MWEFGKVGKDKRGMREGSGILSHAIGIRRGDGRRRGRRRERHSTFRMNTIIRHPCQR
jgi:hypothetical protein